MTELPTSSFSRFIRSSKDDSSIYLPTLHLVSKVTAGLNVLYNRIKDGKNLTQTQTDANGKFIPKRKIFIAGRYIIRGSIATKGQSAVLIKAQDSYRENQKVIIKVVHRTYLAAGLKELFTLRRINSLDPSQASHTVRLINSFFHDGHICLVFQCYDSRPVTKVLAEARLADQKLSSALRKISRHLLTALAFLRTQKIIHADLKPDNILLDKGGDLDTITLIDFGNSLNHSESFMYYDDFEIQTLSYRAPEVHLGMPFGLEIDMWSLGCVLFECYTGRTLFSGVDKEDIFQKIVSLLGPPPAHMNGKFSFNLKPSCGQKKNATLGLMSIFTDQTNFQFASFLSGLLAFCPEDRLTPWEALQHPFMLTDICIPFFLGELPPYSCSVVQHKDYLFKPIVSDTNSLFCLQLRTTDLITNQEKNASSEINVTTDSIQSPGRLHCSKTLNDHTHCKFACQTPSKHESCKLPQQDFSKSLLFNIPSLFEKTDLASEEKCKRWLWNMTNCTSSLQQNRTHRKFDTSCTTNDIVTVDHFKQQEMKHRKDIVKLKVNISPKLIKKERCERSHEISYSQKIHEGHVFETELGNEIQSPLKTSMICQKYIDKSHLPKENIKTYLNNPPIMYKKECNDLESKISVSPEAIKENRDKIHSPGVNCDISEPDANSFTKRACRKRIPDKALTVYTSPLLPKKLKNIHPSHENMNASNDRYSKQSRSYYKMAINDDNSSSHSLLSIKDNFDAPNVITRDLSMTYTLDQIKPELNKTFLKDSEIETFEDSTEHKNSVSLHDSAANINVLKSGNRREPRTNCNVSSWPEISYSECENKAFLKCNEIKNSASYNNIRETHHQRLKKAEGIQNVKVYLHGQSKNIKASRAINSGKKLFIDSNCKLNNSATSDTKLHPCTYSNNPLVSNHSQTNDMSSSSGSCRDIDPAESSHCEDIDGSCRDSDSSHSEDIDGSCKDSESFHTEDIDGSCRDSDSSHTEDIDGSCNAEHIGSHIDCPLHSTVTSRPSQSEIRVALNQKLIKSQRAPVSRNLKNSFAFNCSNKRKPSPSSHHLVQHLENMDSSKGNESCWMSVNVDRTFGQVESVRYLTYDCVEDHKNGNAVHNNQNQCHASHNSKYTSNRNNLTSPVGLKTKQRLDIVHKANIDEQIRSLDLKTKRLDCVHRAKQDNQSTPGGLKTKQRQDVLFSNRSIQQISELNTTYSVSSTEINDGTSVVVGDDYNTNIKSYKHLKHRKVKCQTSGYLPDLKNNVRTNEKKKNSYLCSEVNSSKGNKMDNDEFKSPTINRHLVRAAEVKFENREKSERHLNIDSHVGVNGETSHSRLVIHVAPEADVTYSIVNTSKGSEDKIYTSSIESDGSIEHLSSNSADEDVLLLP